MRNFLIGSIALVCALLSTRPSTAMSAPAASAPNLNAAALRAGGGHLAFVWRGSLFIVAARDGIVHRVASGRSFSDMRWSDDGATLEYRAGDTIWTVRSDGTGRRRVTGCPPSVSLCNAATSPDRSTFAYVRTPPYPGDAHGAVWSDELYTVPASRRTPQLRYTARGAGIRLAGWAGANALVFWIDPMHSGSLAADGLPLTALTFGQAPKTLTTTLPNLDWIAWSPRRDRLLTVAGGPRTIWSGKRLVVCTPARGTCTPVAREPGSVEVDPAWSPRGGRIAFVRARDLGDGWSMDATKLKAWVASRTLWVAEANGARASSVAIGNVYRPSWSSDGSRLLYVRDNALWVQRPGVGTATRLLGPFPNPPNPMGDGGMYGCVFWSSTYAWSPR